jgi:GT2 family glycosyltransferase
MESPLVSIITVNYNHPEVTCELLASLRKITYRNIEIIVVDNASPNDDPSIIKDSFPEVTFIQSKENLGFAGGNNLAIKHSKGEYILMINNDTEVDPGFLEPLVTKFQANAMIGGVSPKIRFYHQPDTLQFTGLTPINSFTIRSRGLGFGMKDEGQFDKDTLTSFIHGAAMMVSRKVLQKVGLMAESYFLYYEELDWGGRIRKAGFELWYVHNSLVMHKESISTGKLSPLKTYYMNRSRLLYLRRNVNGIAFFIALLYQLFVSIPKNAMMFAIRKDKGHISAYNRAVWWHIKTMTDKRIHFNPQLS